LKEQEMATETAELQRPLVPDPFWDPDFVRRVQEIRAQLKDSGGEPLDSPWHRLAINLLIELVRSWFAGRTDYFVGGNMFVYFSMTQIRGREFRGPDFFFVKNVDGTRERLFWYAFEEGGRLPDLIIELLSPSTAAEDRTSKKQVYQDTFRTREYFLFDPSTQRWEGWRLSGTYQPVTADERGWMWCEELGLWLGTWEGVYQETHAVWPRFFDAQGRMVSTEIENQQQRTEDERKRADDERKRADDERKRADDERKRAESLQAELTRVKAMLAERSGSATQHD
jgi:Uma2 family endonuclease